MSDVKSASSRNDEITPERMAAAGVPLALANWFHMIGRHLTKYTDWDVERIMQVRLQVALVEPNLNLAPTLAH